MLVLQTTIIGINKRWKGIYYKENLCSSFYYCKRRGIEGCSRESKEGQYIISSIYTYVSGVAMDRATLGDPHHSNPCTKTR